MSIEEHKAMVRQFVEEFWNKGNLLAADEMMAGDVTLVLPGVGRVDLANFKAFAKAIHSAFPDWHATVEELIAEGNWAAERWRGQGTHQGEFQGIAPTGRQVTVPGAVFYRIADGKIAEFQGLFDSLAMLQQLGALPQNH